MRGARLVLISLLILSITVLAVACGSEETTPTPTQEPTLEPTPTGTAQPTTPSPTPQPTAQPDMALALEALKDLPLEWQETRYVGIETTRQTPDLSSDFAAYETGVRAGLAALGMDIDDVSWLGFSAGRATVYGGEFDVANMGTALADDGYQEDTYLGATIWQHPEDGNVVAILGTTRVVLAHNLDEAKLCVSVMTDWAESLLDDGNIEDAVLKMPSKPLRIDLIQGGYSGLIVSCTGVSYLGGGTLAMQTAAKFLDKAAAAKGLTYIEDSFDGWVRSWSIEDAEVVQIQRFVRLTGTAEISNVDRPLGYWTHWLQ